PRRAQCSAAQSETGDRAQSREHREEEDDASKSGIRQNLGAFSETFNSVRFGTKMSCIWIPAVWIPAFFALLAFQEGRESKRERVERERERKAGFPVPRHAVFW
ncbi:hypothetical protein AMELA_G00098360, partial [Ameiurus melas]